MKFAGDLFGLLALVAIAALFFNNPNSLNFMGGALQAYVGGLKSAATIGQ
jgi:hypothetical protein